MPLRKKQGVKPFGSAFSARLRLVSVAVAAFTVQCGSLQATTVSTSFGKSYQVNVNASGQNIAGDAANEPAMCIDPTNPNHLAIGWRQFDSTNTNFRQAGIAYSTNGGLNWTFPGDLEPGTFRSDPVLASDPNGVFYYLGVSNTATFACDLLRSTNGGMTWQRVGPALGGDKPWMTVDTTSGPGRGNIYQAWSPIANVYTNPNFILTRSNDGGTTWMTAIGLPHAPHFGTLDVGPEGELYIFGVSFDSTALIMNRSTNAQNVLVTPTVDLTTTVVLGGPQATGGINPEGLLGQAWVAVDRSAGPTRGYVYALCPVTNDPGNFCNVMFSRSTDRGQTWSPALRINDDSASQHAYHWFGTLSVAPDGRVDACWNDTRHSTNNSQSELYYSWSADGGMTWAPNRPISPPFNHFLGYPQQSKMGDYIQMISLNEGACITYTATFNSEEDIYFVRAELPIVTTVALASDVAHISWNAVPGISYLIQGKASLIDPWSNATNVTNIVASVNTASIDVPLKGKDPSQFYRVVRQPDGMSNIAP